MGNRPGLPRVAAVLAFACALGAPAWAHLERPSQFPSGSGSVPEYRTSGPTLVVCKPDTPSRIAHYPPRLRLYNLRLYLECRRRGFRDLQAAVNAVRQPGTRILVQPGVYREWPSREPPTGACADLVDNNPLSYEEQRACPHLQNLVAIFGDGPDEDIACDGPRCRLQVEGTGLRSEDVVVDGSFTRLNVVRADRADGVYFRNFTVQHSTFNAVYVLETDGFVIDGMVGRWNDEYGFLTFSSDHGLYTDCEAYGNGDGGLYPGSAADLGGSRPAVEIRRCRSHHNLIGLSGTAGNSLYVHDNDFHHNSVGVSLDSAFPNHPGLPQDSAVLVGNRIWANNEDYYRFHRDGTCALPSAERGYAEGVVCPAALAPVGTGLLLAGGNDNLYQGNWIWDNWRFGAMQFWVPAFIRGERSLAKLLDTSHRNTYSGNLLGRAPDGSPAPNGTDFWWDEEGARNCWQDNVVATGDVTSDPPALPDCSAPRRFRLPKLAKLAALLRCSGWSPEQPDPPGCDWTFTPAAP